MAFLLVIILFISIFMVIFIQMQSSLKKEMNESSSYIVEHTKSIVDTTIHNLQTNAAQLSLDSQMRTLLQKAGEFTDDDYYVLYKSITTLKQMRALNADIEAIAILDIPKQRAYSTDGSTTLESYYSVRYADPSRTYEEWLSYFDQSRPDFFFTSVQEESAARIQRINYVRSVESDIPRDLSMCVVFTVTQDSILKKLDDIQKINLSSLYIVDQDQNIVLASDDTTLPQDIPAQMKNASGSFQAKFEDGAHMVHYTHSGVAKWDYIAVFRDSNYIGKINLMWYYCFGGLLVALLFGALLTWIFIKRNYMPIQNLMSLFGKHGYLADMNENEYRTIEAFVRKAIQYNTDLDKQVDEQRRILRSRALERVLKGRPGREDVSGSEALAQYDVVFSDPYFAVMLFFVDPEEQPQVEEENYSYHETVFIISNVVEEMIGEKNQGIMTECEGLVACIVNLKAENLADYAEILKDVASRANSFILKNFGIVFTVSVSSVVRSLDEIHEAYEEALDVMKYKEAMGIRHTLCYDEIQDVGARIYNYPYNMEQRLGNMIRAGNYEDAVRAIDNIFESNLDKNLDAPSVAQYLMISLTSTISRTLNEMSGETDGSFHGEVPPIYEMLACKTVPEMRMTLYEYLKTLCGSVAQASQQGENWIKKDVLPHVAANYADVNLSVSQIAEEFHVHPVYLSRLFKEQMGEGLLEYITKFRVERAKEILRESKLMLDDVALAVGYNNARTFSRAFKKIEGITPGKYREIQP